MGIQCVQEMREKITQDRTEKSVSYAKKFESKDNLINYRILLTKIIPNKNQTLREVCFKTGFYPINESVRNVEGIW